MSIGSGMSRCFIKPNLHFEFFIQNYLKEELKDKNSEKIEQEIKYYTNIVHEWLETANSEFIGISKNKLDDSVLVLYRYNTIYLMGRTYQTVMYAPKIMFHRVSDTHLHIDDVLMRTNDIGNGSIAMEGLLFYAKLNNIEMITGDLSSVDDDHKSRRDHYYEKFGFEVLEHSIKKII